MAKLRCDDRMALNYMCVRISTHTFLHPCQKVWAPRPPRGAATGVCVWMWNGTHSKVCKHDGVEFTQKPLSYRWDFHFNSRGEKSTRSIWSCVQIKMDAPDSTDVHFHLYTILHLANSLCSVDMATGARYYYGTKQASMFTLESASICLCYLSQHECWSMLSISPSTLK